MIKFALTRILIAFGTVVIMLLAVLLLGVVYIAKIFIAIKYRRPI